MPTQNQIKNRNLIMNEIFEVRRKKIDMIYGTLQQTSHNARANFVSNRSDGALLASGSYNLSLLNQRDDIYYESALVRCTIKCHDVLLDSSPQVIRDDGQYLGYMKTNIPVRLRTGASSYLGNNDPVDWEYCGETYRFYTAGTKDGIFMIEYIVTQSGIENKIAQIRIEDNIINWRNAYYYAILDDRFFDATILRLIYTSRILAMPSFSVTAMPALSKNKQLDK